MRCWSTVGPSRTMRHSVRSSVTATSMLSRPWIRVQFARRPRHHCKPRAAEGTRIRFASCGRASSNSGARSGRWACPPAAPGTLAQDQTKEALPNRLSLHGRAQRAVLYLSLIWLPLSGTHAEFPIRRHGESMLCSGRCYEESTRPFRPNARRLSMGPRAPLRNVSPAKHRSSF